MGNELIEEILLRHFILFNKNCLPSFLRNKAIDKVASLSFSAENLSKFSSEFPQNYRLIIEII